MLLIRALVQAFGGFWTFRQSVVTRPSRWKKSLYKSYLETFNGYISLLATFDGPPTLPHKPAGVFIAPDARIGRNVTIYQHVTIGRNDLPTSKGFGSPTIGDGVYIGAGAKIIGRVHVGAGARIGAGTVVTRDVPDGATVVSGPPVVVVRDPSPAQ